MVYIKAKEVLTLCITLPITWEIPYWWGFPLLTRNLNIDVCHQARPPLNYHSGCIHSLPQPILNLPLGSVIIPIILNTAEGDKDKAIPLAGRLQQPHEVVISLSGQDLGARQWM